jgi:hypothetical protein
MCWHAYSKGYSTSVFVTSGLTGRALRAEEEEEMLRATGHRQRA